MENTALIAMSRQSVLRRKMNIIANNLANMNTTAFKGDKIMFTEHLVKSKGGERMAGQNIAFVRDIATVHDFREGPIKTTGNSLDVAIQGEGYLVIDTPEGERYTRNGRMQMDAEGQLVTQHGFPVLSDDGEPFVFNATDGKIQINLDGTISTDNGDVGRLRLVRFDAENELNLTYGGLYEAEETPTDVTEPSIVQHALEGSNVEPIIEITNMIQVQRSYEGAKKLIEGEDERIKKMIREFGRSIAA